MRLRFYAGLTVAETAEALGISERTVHREWSFARARLAQDLLPESADCAAAWARIFLGFRGTLLRAPGCKQHTRTGARP